MRARSRVAGALIALVVGAGLAGCGSSGAVPTGVKTLDLPALNGTVLDLSAQQETGRVSALKGVTRPYIDKVAFYSLRSDNLLEAILQVSHFTKGARVNSAQFRNSVISQLGSSTPHEFRMGANRVFLTTGRRQTVAAWFRGAYLFVLSTRDEYPRPRELLRTVLGIRP